jgi:flagellin
MSAIIATNAIISNDRDQQVAMERLSTGLRINSAADDAAGLAISSRMQAEVTGLQMSTRNANDAISMLETLEGSSREVAAALQRMRELAVQSGSDTMGVTDRAALDLEFGQLFNEIQRIATQTTWNNITVMNGANDAAGAPVITSAVTAESLVIQLGKAAGQNMTVTFKSFHPQTTVRANAQMEMVNPATGVQISAGNVWAGAAPTAANAGGGTIGTRAAATSLGHDTQGNDNSSLNSVAATGHSVTDTTAYGSAVLWTGDGAGGGVARAAGVGGPVARRIDILSLRNANYSLLNLDKAITAVSAERARYGAFISRLEHAGENLTNVARHQEQSRSRIADADYATETSELSRTTIIAQASTAMLAQANAAKQTVLTLLQ